MKKMILCGLIMLGLCMLSEAMAAEQTLGVVGSTTVGPIADAFADDFKSSDPSVKITVSKVGSGTGAKALIEGSCDVATMSRFMKEQEFKDAVARNVFPVAHVVAMDAVCMVVHPSNPVKELTSEQVRKIYKGEIKNWKQVGGVDMPIIAISRDTESGTYETFNEFLMKQEKIASSVEYVNSNPQAHARVSSTQGAIGYVGFGFMDDKVKGLKIDSVMPSRDTILNGSYIASRPLYMFTNGYPRLGSPAHKYVAFYLTEQGQEIIEGQGFVPVTNY
jgi:phosphate transport system substrate-binding protein